MSPKRLFRLPEPWGSRLDRATPVAFHFDGRPVSGFAGDTLASAILADPRHGDFLARSFKYHRPRGPLLANGMDANQYVTLDGTPNVAADGTRARDGAQVRSQNVAGSLARDRGALLGTLARFLPAGFYYDTFFRPAGSWPFWERIIRRVAGLGRLDPTLDAFGPEEPEPEKHHLFSDVAVIGAGVAGLSAALGAAREGREVILIERDEALGGRSAFARLSPAQRRDLAALIAQVERHPAITVLTSTTCAAWFEGNLLTAHARERYYHVRARHVIAAVGSVEQPLVLRNNDLPGIFLASSVNRLMAGYALCPGRRCVVQTANRFGYETALALAEAGCTVLAVLDMRAQPVDAALEAQCAALGIAVLHGLSVVEAHRAGQHLGAVSARSLDANGHPTGPVTRWRCDTLVCSVGFTPLVQLACHSGGEAIYDTALSALRITRSPRNSSVCGSLNGIYDFDAVCQDGQRAADVACGKPASLRPEPAREPVNFPWTVFPHRKGKEFVDFDEDQTIGDIETAVQAGFGHMELMKRFTTTGMGPSQGRTTALNALRVFAGASGQDLAHLRMTTQRPPFEPEPFANLAVDTSPPQRRGALDRWHRENGAVMMPAGAWLRPAHYGGEGDEEGSVEREVRAVRARAGLFDASTHGGFQLAGRDALALLNAAYVQDFSDLACGATRAGLMVDELGAVIDDCVACRLDADRLYLVTSSAAAAATNRTLRKLIVEHGFDVTVCELQGAMSVLNLCGPQARAIIAALWPAHAGELDALALHGFCQCTLEGIPAIVLRGDFVGETTFEFHVGSGFALTLWNRLLAAGAPFAIRPFGVLAQRVLRLEKAHFIIGQDTDHATGPDDIGKGAAVAMDKPYFLGRSAIAKLRTKAAPAKALRPFCLDASQRQAPEECRLLEGPGGVIGRVTSAAYSPTLGRVVGLALLDDPAAAAGTVRLWGAQAAGAKVRFLDHAPYDPAGERQA
ncbi:FAD-dependent oxidoreductase [Novosphingobium sp. 1949]|uniref:FAD-dependent oxidoreductase n=1 Tax=Novosphingobium organovorum TaxID=2930092 RepID=A0ABT0BCZ4_9SPHN|nr:FAD-dependent oxidoreductase [Novosphingobium organovorum]MCJ2182671.1 FAD-dependent oxidoreductase [Novosphingobium organovorum]